MKKLFIFLFVLTAMLTSCTMQTISRHVGGSFTIELDPGQKLVEATWKDANLWVLTAPMDSTYTPQTLILKEYSEFGVLEGEIKFIESRYIPNE